MTHGIRGTTWDEAACTEQLRGWVLRMAQRDEAALGCLYQATLSRVYGLSVADLHTARSG